MAETTSTLTGGLARAPGRAPGAGPSWAALAGRPFVHPVFDYLLIGGGLSLAFTVALVLHPAGEALVSREALPYFFLLANAAHFAASTVRLYAKPGARQTWPFLTMGFPLVALGILTACIVFAGQLGPHLQSLYLTWSPYHYAAQAYGIAVVYSFRSGCPLSPTSKRALRWVAMLPFLYNFLTAPDVGLHWLAPVSVTGNDAMRTALGVAHWTLLGAAFVAPLWLFHRVWREGKVMPLIALLSVVANGVWFFVLAPLDAFIYATIFHGIQYLAIVIIFHLKDQMARPGNRHGRPYHVVWFYGVSLLLGYALFNCLPLAYVWAGFGRVESVLLVVAAINVHHFIVDAFIWRFRKGDSNRRVVAAEAPA